MTIRSNKEERHPHPPFGAHAGVQSLAHPVTPIGHDCTGHVWPCPCGHLITAWTGWGARLGRWWHRRGCRK